MKWEDVGGLEDVKKSILDTVQVRFFSQDTLMNYFCLMKSLKHSTSNNETLSGIFFKGSSKRNFQQALVCDRNGWELLVLLT